MSEQRKKPLQPNLDAQSLSDFIYALNIARRQLSLFPAGHPLINSSSNTALEVLGHLSEFRAAITFGVAPDALLLDQEWLDKSNPVYRDFARFLFDFGVASISFHSGLTSEELIRFNQLLRSDRKTIEACGGFSQLLPEQQISHVTVIPIDYSLFQSAALDSRGSDRKSAPGELLWDDFLHGLLADGLDQQGEAGNHQSERLDPAIVAGILNRQQDESTAAPVDYGQAISSYVVQMKSRGEDKQQLGTLLQNLGPELRRQFLNSTFRALEQQPETATEVLPSIPRELLIEALELQNKKQLNVSSRLVDLLGHFAANAPAVTGRTVKARAAIPLTVDIVQARMEILFNGDDHDRYVPDTYQNALQSILNGELKGTVSTHLEARLKNTLEKQSVEKQCCAIIFNMLRQKLSAETESVLQENLAELSRYFLDTGDFLALKEIYLRWSTYLYSELASACFLDEKVLSSHIREDFMEDVLDGIKLWGKEKQDEICDYVAEIGEPYAELLVERLGNEEQMLLRRTWMKLLTGIGANGQQAILAALQDKRWYLVRNLLTILSKQRDKLPMKAIQQLAGHTHPKVRQEVLSILFRLNPATADRLLRKELASNDPQVLLPAVQVAALSRDPVVLERLHQLLTDELLGETELELKKQLLPSLAGIGAAGSIQLLQHLVQKKGLLLPRRFRELQLEIIRSLGSYPQPVVEPLLQTLSASRNQQHASLAAEQLRQLKGAVL